MDTNYRFVESQVVEQIKKVLSAQKFVNKTLNTAAKMNIMASVGNGVESISKCGRDRKGKKMERWIDKSTNKGRNMPKIKGIDKIKILDV